MGTELSIVSATTLFNPPYGQPTDSNRRRGIGYIQPQFAFALDSSSGRSLGFTRPQFADAPALQMIVRKPFPVRMSRPW